MPEDQHEEPTPSSENEDICFGVGDRDATDDLVRWVRMNFAEHHSDLSDETPRASIVHLVKLTISGMCALGVTNEEEEDDDGNTCPFD